MDIASLQETLRRTAAELLRIAEQAGIALSADGGAKTHVLVDWENVQPKEDDCRAIVPEATDVWLFHGPTQKNVVTHYGSFGARAMPVRGARAGKNALDFLLSFYLGYLASRDPQARFVVVSNDKGYGPMLEHAKELGFAATQVGFARARKKAPASARKTARKSTAARPPAAAKKAAAAKGSAARKAPAKKAQPAKRAAPAKKTAVKSAPAAAPAAAKTAAPAPKQGARKTFDQVLAILRKGPVSRRPAKQRSLLAQLASLIGGGAGTADAQAMLDRLVAERHLGVDAKGTVTYRL
jgi:hypothetical protein